MIWSLKNQKEINIWLKIKDRGRGKVYIYIYIYIYNLPILLLGHINPRLLFGLL